MKDTTLGILKQFVINCVIFLPPILFTGCTQHSHALNLVHSTGLAIIAMIVWPIILVAGYLLFQSVCIFRNKRHNQKRVKKYNTQKAQNDTPAIRI